MGSLVGFTLCSCLPENRLMELEKSQVRALSHFSKLATQTRVIGESRLYLWGHADFSDYMRIQPDGSLLALIGSPVMGKSLDPVAADLAAIQRGDEFIPPWDGRAILLWVSADGKQWRMWNDWLGSIPVYHATVGKGRLASTLESVVVDGAGYTPDDFHLPALVSLLVNGHYLSDWTLYKDIKTLPPDSFAEWDEAGFHARSLGSIYPFDDYSDVSWDDLVDEMYALSRQAVTEVLQTRQSWILPLSAGLDSRLIAAVAADLGVDIHAYAWGESESTDVIFSRRIARRLGFPWKHVELPDDFLIRYTPQWADVFGSSMHFHGMYQVAFLDAICAEPGDALVSGFIGDVLSGSSLMQFDQGSAIYKKDWYLHWTTREVGDVLKIPIHNALEEITAEVKKISDNLQGSRFSKGLLFELWTRQRYFTYFQSTLSDYWRGIATPFLNRKYARYCLSLPRIALENRRLLGDVFRRHYGKLAVIPGTYADEPFIRTGRYLIKQRIARRLPSALHIGPFAGFDNIPLRMDIQSIQASGKEALWPLFDARDRLSDWLDFDQLERDFQTIMTSQEDIRPLRRLQSAQMLAYRLMD